jgi:hypothetical protein
VAVIVCRVEARHETLVIAHGWREQGVACRDTARESRDLVRAHVAPESQVDGRHPLWEGVLQTMPRWQIDLTHVAVAK